MDGPDRSLGGLRRGLHGASVTLAGATLLLGLVVLFGWYTGNRTLVLFTSSNNIFAVDMATGQNSVAY